MKKIYLNDRIILKIRTIKPIYTKILSTFTLKTPTKMWLWAIEQLTLSNKVITMSRTLSKQKNLPRNYMIYHTHMNGKCLKLDTNVTNTTPA